MRKRRKKTHVMRNLKKKFCLAIFFLFLGILFLSLVLDGYLFSIQKKSRLSKKKEFNDFVLCYTKESRCEIKEKLKKDNVTYYYDCLDMVYLQYGETEILLEEAIEKGYINLKILLESTTFDGREEDASIYVSKHIKGKEPYRIKIIEKDEETFVTISSQN